MDIVWATPAPIPRPLQHLSGHATAGASLVSKNIDQYVLYMFGSLLMIHNQDYLSEILLPSFSLIRI